MDAEDASEEIFFDLFLQESHARSVQERNEKSDQAHQEEINPEVRDDAHPERAQTHYRNRGRDGMDPILESAP
ncbi:hypothetical protein SDC9_89802 [bioreactor metagenome]|uniref:Uncharacterized protein n=1 Tax=bioreactor metagenome TaxID=1076179 RepID=A0A644ZQ69_9ZZZZ